MNLFSPAAVAIRYICCFLSVCLFVFSGWMTGRLNVHWCRVRATAHLNCTYRHPNATSFVHGMMMTILPLFSHFSVLFTARSLTHHEKPNHRRLHHHCRLRLAIHFPWLLARLVFAFFCALACFCCWFFLHALPDTRRPKRQPNTDGVVEKHTYSLRRGRQKWFSLLTMAPKRDATTNGVYQTHTKITMKTKVKNGIWTVFGMHAGDIWKLKGSSVAVINGWKAMSQERRKKKKHRAHIPT